MRGARDAPPKTASRFGPSSPRCACQVVTYLVDQSAVPSLGTRAWVNSPVSRFAHRKIPKRQPNRAPLVPGGRAKRLRQRAMPLRPIHEIGGTLFSVTFSDFSSRMRIVPKVSMTRRIPWNEMTLLPSTWRIFIGLRWEARRHRRRTRFAWATGLIQKPLVADWQ